MHDDMARVESLLAKGRVDESDPANEQNILMGPEVDSPGGGPHREPVPVDITVPAKEGDKPGWKPDLSALSLADRAEDRRRSNIEVSDPFVSEYPGQQDPSVALLATEKAGGRGTERTGHEYVVQRKSLGAFRQLRGSGQPQLHNLTRYDPKFFTPGYMAQCQQSQARMLLNTQAGDFKEYYTQQIQKDELLMRKSSTQLKNVLVHRRHHADQLSNLLDERKAQRLHRVPPWKQKSSLP